MANNLERLVSTSITDSASRWRQALAAALQRLAERRAFDAQQAAAAAARQKWERRQQRLRKRLPRVLWQRAKAAWGTDLLPLEIHYISFPLKHRTQHSVNSQDSFGTGFFSKLSG